MAEFPSIYREHFPFVWRSLRRLGVPEADVPDLVQEVFLVVHRRLHDFEGRSKITTWLFGICLNAATSHRRLAHVRREVSCEESKFPDRADEYADGEVAAQRREGLTLLDSVLTRMNPEQRAVFLLFEVEEMSS